MSRVGRIRAESTAAWYAFFRRRTAVFFTFFFPALLVVIFGVLVGTQPAGGGLFTESPSYYLAGYLAVVVLFTPLSRVGSEVARHHRGARFQKLATTPLSRTEWLFAQTCVNVVVIGLASLLVLVLVVLLTGAALPTSPGLLFLPPFVAFGVATFCGVGAMIGRLADSPDGVIAASNALALPLLFLSETFVPPELLPAWLPTWLSPLTYFARGVRAVTTPRPQGTVLATYDPTGLGVAGLAGDPLVNLIVLGILTLISFLVGAWALPWTE